MLKDLLQPKFKGVYGWLFFLCFLLVIIRPLFGLVQIINLYGLYNDRHDISRDCTQQFLLPF